MTEPGEWDHVSSGWAFRSHSSHISGNAALLSLSRELSDPYAPPGEPPTHPFCVHGSTRSLKPCMCGSALVMGVNMHLPDAVFGANHLTLSHLASGFTLRLDAAGALRAWARDSVARGSRQLRVPPAAAPAWRERMAAARGRSSVDVDWTFRCEEYAPDGEVGGGGAAPRAGAGEGGERGKGRGVAPPVVGGTHLISLKPAEARGARGGGVQWRPHKGAALEPESEAGMMLRRQDPILWSCDIPLYFDAMHDHGESEVRVRVRVTPRCFLVLLRHHLVINGVMIAHKELRYFHAFGERTVLRTHTRRSMTLPQDGRPLRLIDEQQAARMLAASAESGQCHTDSSADELDLHDLLAAQGKPLPPPRDPAADTIRPTPAADAQARLDRILQSKGGGGGVAPPTPPLPAAGDAQARLDRILQSKRGGAGAATPPSPLPATATPSPPLPTATTPPLPLPAAATPSPSLPTTAASPSPSLDVAPSPSSLPPAATTSPPLPPATPPSPRTLLSTSLLASPLAAPLSSLAISADGALLAAADCEGTLLLLRHGHPSPLWREDSAHAGGVTAVGFAGEGPACRLASCGEDGTCKLWHVEGAGEAAAWAVESETADRAYRGTRSTAIVQALACERGGGEAEGGGVRLCAAAGASVFLLDSRRAREVSRTLAAPSGVSALEYAPALRRLYASGYGGVSVWSECGWGAPLARLPFKGPLDSLSVSPDERYVAAGAQDGTLVMWPLRGEEAARGEKRGGEGQEEEEALSRLLGSESNGKELGLLRGQGLAALEAAAPLDEATAAQRSGAALFFGGGAFEQKVVPVAWHATGRLCASAGGRCPVVWDMGAAGAPPPVRRNGRASRLLGHAAAVTSLAFAPPPPADESFAAARLAAAALDGRVAVYELRAEPEAGEREPGATHAPVAVSPPPEGVRRAHPILVWGRGCSAGWLFCGIDRQLAAYQL
ncbi:hypothetical protein AB1Y20_021111 [Prymnesium parvum]|uniref:Uncharacterized protein n=1 Tax=Prymnesium parvum TaxID=97485 RepID=A0AB34JKM3_PRYPA